MIPMDKNVCVDEEMIPYKERRGSRYYIKESPTLGVSKYGPLLITMALYTILKFVLDQLLRSMDSLILNPVLILYAN